MLKKLVRFIIKPFFSAIGLSNRNPRPSQSADRSVAESGPSCGSRATTTRKSFVVAWLSWQGLSYVVTNDSRPVAEIDDLEDLIGQIS